VPRAQGDADGFTSVKQLQRNVKAASGPTKAHIFPGCGHFELEGEHYDARIADLIVSWLGDQQELLQP
jgi:fermentation-respiration switch protein FrsA (DUF1100 family)